MQDNAREAAERAAQQIDEKILSASTQFSDSAAQLAREQFDSFSAATRSAFDQNTAYLEAQTVQVRAKLDTDARTFASDFQRVLANHTDQTLAHGKQELTNHVDQSKDALRIESQARERQFQESLTSLGAFAMDEHKQRLDNASNSWLLTTVAKLNQQSEALIDDLAHTTETKLRAVCGAIFAEVGETLRQRLAGLAAPPAAPTNFPEEKK